MLHLVSLNESGADCDDHELFESDETQRINSAYKDKDKMVVVRALKDILAIKIKTRHDGVCDQWSRLFMTKMLLIASFVMGFDYFSDKVTCMTDKSSDLSKEFIHSACWISGFYIYEEMTYQERLPESSYYGIPRKVEKDGLDIINQLCARKDIYETNKDCKPMTKIYYLQYQWLPFYIGALALVYYLPYIIFRLVNADLISLKTSVKSTTCDAENLVKNYFNYKINTVWRLRLRVIFNVGVKVLYIVANLFAFYFTDYLLLGNYVDYGTNYIQWAKLNTSEAHQLTGFREDAKPGNKLLPSMGFCEIKEAYKGTQKLFHNENKLICEISPNILYQYVLIVLWFLFVVSIAISILGLAASLLGHLYHLCCTRALGPKKSILKFLTLRESEYLVFIKKKNMVLYGDVLRKLRQSRADLHGKVGEGFETSNGFV